MERIAPHVQRVQPDAVPVEFVQPRLSRRRIRKHRIGVQMGVRRITTSADLDRGDLWHLRAQPRQSLLERQVEESLEHY